MSDRKTKKCILFCAGDFDANVSVPDIKRRIAEIDHVSSDFVVIAADGGIGYSKMAGLTPDVLIGDFDSATEAEKEYVNNCSDNAVVLKLPCEKDDTDTIAAIRKGLELGCDEFIIYGATGGRIDHYLANIQTLLFIRHHGAVGRLVGNDCEIFIIENETVYLGKHEHGTVSLFALGEKAEGVTIKGLYYEVEESILTNDYPIGVSNEFCGREASVSVKQGALVCTLMSLY